jgi:hypothetical protein
VLIFTLATFTSGVMPPGINYSYTVQKEQGVRLVSLMQREIILYMVSAICVSSYLADFYLLSKFASLE